MMKKYFLAISLYIIVTLNLNAQLAVGEWRDHFPYIEAIALVKAGNKIFCATPYALFSYNLDDYSVNKLSRTNGLSDVGTCAINYNQNLDVLLVAYTNANLDIVKGNIVYNLNAIKNKQIQGNKKINQIVFRNNLAYIACGFGIVVIDLDRREVKDTYYIGNNASNIQVYSIDFDETNIYAATESGIYYANYNNPNLIDFNQWQKVSSIDNPNGSFSSVLNFNSNVFACFQNVADTTSIIYRKEGNNWTPFYADGEYIVNLKLSNNKFFIIKEKTIKILNTNLLEDRKVDYSVLGNISPLDCYMNNDGVLYVADKYSGLVIEENTSSYQSIKPNGPYNNNVVDIAATNNLVWVAGGGRSPSWGNLYNYCQAYRFTDQNWSSNILWNSSARDFVKIFVNPGNPSQVYAGAWGAGLFEFSDFELVNSYNETNSSLQSIFPGQDYIRIAGIVMDESQNLYVTNSGVNAPISVKTITGDWYSYNYPEISGNEFIGEIIETEYGHKWVQLAKGTGLFAFDDKGTPSDMDDDDKRKFSIFDETGQVVTNEVFSLAIDEDDVIWVGTDQGVFTYYNSQNVFSGENFYADRVKVANANSDSIVQYLLANEKVTAIEIDGANRKWFGTENSGVFLMSEDCQDEIFHFTTSNSKLISNTINAIAIDGKSGEVFFGTSIGIVSFKGTATKGDDSYAGAYIYPNPVRENYSGQITITGLAANVNVKITDISGQLVYETTAFGGQALWNGKNFSGRKVNTGVYLVFCVDEEGKNKKVLKLLVIN